MRFSETPNGKAIMHTIHDNNGAVALVKSVSSLIKKKISMGNISNEFLLEMMEVLDKACIKSNEAVDYMYEKLSEDFEEQNKYADLE
jgi:surface antigen